MSKTTTSATKVTLRKPQIKILKALSKFKRPLSRKMIAEKAEVDLAWLNSWIGSHDDSIRAKNDKKLVSLLTLRMVKYAAPEEGTGAVYEITALGKAYLAKQ